MMTYIVGYVDSVWGNSDNDRKSISGYLFKVYKNCTTSWNSKKQNTVTTLPIEAVFNALKKLFGLNH